MKKTLLTILLCLLVSANVFGQANNATLTGTVADVTGAVLPGVMITATNNATGVMVTTITNEAGAYNIQSLIPGTYTITSELPGFQKQTYTNTALGNAVTVRLNFTLQVASQAQSVEVTVAADTLLATSSPTIGQVLTEKKVEAIPVVGNNVLDMLTVLGGIDNFVATNAPGASAFGRETTTLAGVSAQATPVLRDGVMVQDQRYPTGINTATVINPDLVGEIRLIVSPVDAELGRGNGAIQIQTRSGTNQFRGAAVWNIQNTALNPNSWSNNRNPGRRIEPTWSNTNQGTVSVGGPIVKNKTFFYALWDMNINRQRANTYATVLTPCARNGIFRYFDNVNNGAYGATPVLTGPTPTMPVVDLNGNPVSPNGSPLRYISVFGPVTFPNNTPNADCSNGTVTGSWDQFRRAFDSTGLIKRTIDLMPQPNDFTNANNANGFTADGLNIASYRYIRRYRGLDNLFSVGESTGDRRQINAKIDHNFSQQHRANVNVSYERVVSDDTVEGLPNTWSNQNYHRPLVVTSGFVSTLSASIVNEAKFGYRVNGTNVLAPWDLPENIDSISKYLPAKINGFLVLPDITGGIGVCSPITGARPPGNCLGTNPLGNNITATARDKTPSWTYGDSLSWTKGVHSFKFGGELRFNSSTSTGSSPGNSFFSNFKSPVVVVAGATAGSGLQTTGPTAIANTNPNMPGIGTNDATRARNLLNFLSGSLQSVNNEYFLTDPKATTFSDYRNASLISNTIKQREFSIFVKDDWKIRRSLTLNVGLRYEWYGVPYSASGLTVAPVGGGSAAFGVSGRDFTSWMKPGNVDLSKITTLEFVGPGSPNPDKTVYKNDWNNFGPAVGFAWQVPWFGKDKTTMRGGYQITFQGGGRFNTLEGPLSNPPGKTFDGSYVGDSSDPYLDLSKIARVIPAPLPAGQQPMLPIPITNRTQNISFFDTDYVAPYTQNMTLSITHSVRSNLSVDVRYIGTLSRKNFATFNLNSPNFVYNGLAAEFDKVRTGGQSAVLDQMLKGINICVNVCSGTFGAIGDSVNGVVQTAAMQLRASSTFNTNLAQGNYTAVATSLNTLNYVKTATANANLPDVPSTVRGAALRINGVPENLISTNPQFGNVTYLTNASNSNYHSVQAEVNLRPTHGFFGSMNYTFSKNLGLPCATCGITTFTDPTNRHADYSIVNNNHPHVLRTNGGVELPFGPGKLLFANSSGVLARALEQWNLGVIYTLSSGQWQSITTNNSLYANGVPDVVNSDLLKELLDDTGVRWGVPSGNGTLDGRFFDPAKWVKTADPQCATVTASENLNGLQSGNTPRCTLQALARIVPAGTAGAIVTARDAQGNPTQFGQIVLQNPRPGTRGNLGRNIFRDLPVFRFDANLSKAFKITESKSLLFRADVQNVLNHPQPQFTAAGAALSINSANTTTPFGQLNTKTGGRSFQGQLRLQF
jgi:hypothetical protein